MCRPRSRSPLPAITNHRGTGSGRAVKGAAPGAQAWDTAGMADTLDATIAGCTDSHRRLDVTLASIDDDIVGRDSTLAGWTIGHVLSHLARNAESHVRMLAGALAGEAVEQYAGGAEQRRRDIDAGAGRPATLLVAEVRETAAALEAAWTAMTAEAWDGYGLRRGAQWPCRIMPLFRWREVELHHGDLGLGHGPPQWPCAFVDADLPLRLHELPGRLDPDGGRAVLAWLTGRGGPPSGIELTPWEHVPSRSDAAASAVGARSRDRVVTIFRSRLRHYDGAQPGGAASPLQEYQQEAERMVALASAMPGFVDFKTFAAEDGERVSLVTFASSGAHDAWRRHPDHQVAQQRGRDEFYESYLIQVSRVTAERRFERRDH